MGRQPPAAGRELRRPMTLGGCAARRASYCSLLALFGAFAPGLHAQTPAPAAPPAAPTTTVAPAPDNAEAPTDAGYQDRVIEGLAPIDDDEGGFEYDKAGWPRFLRLETRLGTQPFDTERKTQTAFAVYGLLDPPNHGALSLDGSLSPRESRGTLTLRQRGLPLASGWIGNHEAGGITAPAPGIPRLPSRVYLPSATLRGLAGEWLSPASGLTLQAGSGEPGQIESLPASGFRGLGGRRTTLGAQWHLGASPDSTDPLGLPGWTLALQHEDASRVTALGQTRETGTPLDARSTLFALRHESDSRRTQGQLILSRGDTPATPRASGSTANGTTARASTASASTASTPASAGPARPCPPTSRAPPCAANGAPASGPPKARSTGCAPSADAPATAATPRAAPAGASAAPGAWVPAAPCATSAAPPGAATAPGAGKTRSAPAACASPPAAAQAAGAE